MGFQAKNIRIHMRAGRPPAIDKNAGVGVEEFQISYFLKSANMGFIDRKAALARGVASGRNKRLSGFARRTVILGRPEKESGTK
jgi:hypothetical protein